MLSGVSLGARVDIEQITTVRRLLAMRSVRPCLEPGAKPRRPPDVLVSPPTAIALTSWIAVSGGLLWIAIRTGSVLAWLAFALASLMPALMLMVIAQMPDRTAARMLHDGESMP
jgi:hypothetical protein